MLTCFALHNSADDEMSQSSDHGILQAIADELAASMVRRATCSSCPRATVRLGRHASLDYGDELHRRAPRRLKIGKGMIPTAPCHGLCR